MRPSGVTDVSHRPGPPWSRTRWAVTPGHLDAVPVAEVGTLTEGVDAGILDVALVDLHPLDPLALDPPSLQDAQAPADRGQADPLGSHHGCREVDRLPRLGCLVAADVQFDGAGPVPATALAGLPHAQHMRDQAGIDTEPPHPGSVTAPPHDADPALRAGHPPEGHGDARGVGQAGRRRLDEHDMITCHRDVVLPRGPLERHRLGVAQAAAGLPFPETEPDPLGLGRPAPGRSRPASRPAARTCAVALATAIHSVVHGERHATAVGRHAVHVRRDGHGQTSGELLGLQES